MDVPPTQHQPGGTTTAADAAFLSQLSSSSSSSVGDLHKSNLLRLQVDELIATAAVDYRHVKWYAAAQEYLTNLSGIVESLSLDKIHWNDPNNPWRDHRDLVPSLPLSSHARLRTHVMGTTAADGLGMMTTNSNAKVVPTLHVRVALPSAELWQPKDHLKHKYFQKRNAVVWHVAQQLAGKRYRSVVGSVAWRLPYNDVRKPLLLLQPPTQQQPSAGRSVPKTFKKAKTNTTTLFKSNQPRVRVVLHFGLDDVDVIPPLRLVPNRCNLASTTTTSSGVTHDASSQMYNQALLEDLPIQGNDDDSLAAIVHDDVYVHWKDALVLTQIWCLQRGLLRRHDGFTTESLAWMLVYLYRSRATSPRMQPLQVVQAWWKLLADVNWLGDAKTTTGSMSSGSKSSNNSSTIRKAPSEAYVDIRDGPRKRTVLVVPHDDGASVPDTVAKSALARLYAQQTKESPLTPNDPPTLIELYERQYTLGPVLLDSSMRLNVLGRVSPATMRQAARDAAWSLERLHCSRKPFASLFMQNARFWKRYDAYIRIPYDAFDFTKSKTGLWGANRHDVGDAESIRRGLRHVLGKALNDRVREIQILSTGNGDVHQMYDVSLWQDSDEIPTQSIKKDKLKKSSRLVSPTGDDALVLGLTLDPDVCFRVVDRGPPADDADSTAAFLELWGPKAELRRFKDGAIVHATVWNDDFVVEGDYVHYLNDDKMQGGIVERIIRYILGLHFVTPEAASQVQFSLRDMLSCVDGVQPGSDSEVSFNPLVAHRLVMKAFDSLSDFLRETSRPTISIPGTTQLKSRLGTPLPIDAVEPLAPCLRYADLFPPVPHPLLGGPALPGMQRVSQAVQSKPILIQVRFASSSKWPNDLKAIKAAKTAMLIQILKGIDALRNAGDSVASKFGEHSSVCAESIDVAFQGYVFRIIVRADPELRLLRGLFNPTDEAISLLRSLTKQHLIASKHHSIVHAVYTKCASSSVVVRLAQRWFASHLLSNHFPFESIELMVAFVYSGSLRPTDAPASVTAGFIRFLELLATHDWKQEPLIVDPQNSFSIQVHSKIAKDFELIRGADGTHGPPLFIISPSDRPDWEDEQQETDKESSHTPAKNKNLDQSMWLPFFGTKQPEWVVLNRARALAARSYHILQQQLRQFETDDSAWSVIFTEPSTSFGKYSVLWRVDSDFLVDPEASSSGGKSLAVVETSSGAIQSSYTRSMIERYRGPKPMQRKLFKNLLSQEDILLEWQPVDAMISGLEKDLGHLGLFFYNHLCPEVVGMLWRPNIFSPKPFSAIQSEWARPVVDRDWKSDTLVTVNVSDVLIQAFKYTRHIVVTQKVLDEGMKIVPTDKKKRLRKEVSSDSEGSDGTEDSEPEEEHELPTKERGESDDSSSTGREEDDESHSEQSGNSDDESHSEQSGNSESS